MCRYIAALLVAVTFHSAIANEFVNGHVSTEVIESAEWGDTLVESGRGHISYHWKNVDSAERVKKLQDSLKNSPLKNAQVMMEKKAELFFAFDGPKLRYDKRINHTKDAVSVSRGGYDGEKWHIIKNHMYLSDPTKNSVRASVENRSNPNAAGFEYQHDPRYDMTVFGTPVADFLRGNDVDYGKTSFFGIEQVNEEYVNGFNCIVFRGEIDPEGTLTVWLAKECLYRPVRIVLENGDFKEQINNTLRKYENGLWYLENTHNEIMLKDENGEWYLKTVSDLRLDNDFQINCALDDSLFSLSFPPGVEVFDVRTGKNIISKGD